MPCRMVLWIRYLFLIFAKLMLKLRLRFLKLVICCVRLYESKALLLPGAMWLCRAPCTTNYTCFFFLLAFSQLFNAYWHLIFWFFVFSLTRPHCLAFHYYSLIVQWILSICSLLEKQIIIFFKKEKKKKKKQSTILSHVYHLSVTYQSWNHIFSSFFFLCLLLL